MALAVDFSKQTLVIVTGASQGIGQTIAVQLSQKLLNNSKIILIARSEAGLIKTSELISNVNNNISVEIISLDLTKPTFAECEGILKGEYKAEQALIFHNVGQIGKLTNCINLTDIEVWRNYFDLNVFSVGILNSILVKKLKDVVKKLFVINITSLCGRAPYINLSMYGSGKAARELYFRVFAIEEKDVIVLNYSPGPVDTPMIEEIIETAESEELRSSFVSLKDSTILSPNQTVEKLLSILKSGDFQSGDIIDYYDK